MSQTLSFATFEAKIQSLKTPMGLVLSEVLLYGEGTVIQMDPFKADMIQPGHLLAKINEQGLKVFLDDQAPGGLRDFEVTLDNNQIHIRASLRIIVDIRAEAICTLRIVDNRQLFVDLVSVDVMGVGARGVVESQLEKVNPVLDAKDLPLDLHIESVSIDSGLIELRGRIKPK